jgi:hypothetical protein
VKQFVWLCEGLLMGLGVTAVTCLVWVIVTAWKEKDL